MTRNACKRPALEIRPAVGNETVEQPVGFVLGQEQRRVLGSNRDGFVAEHAERIDAEPGSSLRAGRIPTPGRGAYSSHDSHVPHGVGAAGAVAGRVVEDARGTGDRRPIASKRIDAGATLSDGIEDLAVADEVPAAVAVGNGGCAVGERMPAVVGPGHRLAPDGDHARTKALGQDDAIAIRGTAIEVAVRARPG